MNVVGYVEFACSFGLLGFISIRAAWAFGLSAAERFWIAVAAAAPGRLPCHVPFATELLDADRLADCPGPLAVLAWLVFHPRFHAPPGDNPDLAAVPHPQPPAGAKDLD